jgi:hypothetical protein
MYLLRRYRGQKNPSINTVDQNKISKGQKSDAVTVDRTQDLKIIGMKLTSVLRSPNSDEHVSY